MSNLETRLYNYPSLGEGFYLLRLPFDWWSTLITLGHLPEQIGKRVNLKLHNTWA